MYCGQLGATVLLYSYILIIAHLQVSAKPISLSSKDFSLSLEYIVLLLLLLVGRGSENTSVVETEPGLKGVAMMRLNQNISSVF